MTRRCIIGRKNNPGKHDKKYDTGNTSADRGNEKTHQIIIIMATMRSPYIF